MKTIILYHRDMDGLASALIVRKKFPDAEMISVQYGEEFKMDWLDYDRIILVDFSYKEDIIETIFLQTEEFIWIDHHKTAKEILQWDNKNIEGIRNIEYAACELCWKYFFPDKRKIPMPIQYIADRDMWKFTYGDNTKAFHEILMLNEDNIDLINEVLFHPTKYISWIKQGALLLKYQQTLTKKLFKKGLEGEFRGHKSYEIHSPIFPSELADYTFKQLPEIEIVRIIQKKCVDNKFINIVSLRSRGNVDVSEIAKSVGGGGHHNAAGYSYR